MSAKKRMKEQDWCFNSIKVRLNLTIVKYAITLVLFQFHKGTIKPGLTGGVTGLLSGFQFHKGTIKPISLLTRLIYQRRFNSIKVRLNLTQLNTKLLGMLFQFHKGTIKPFRRLKLIPENTRFNSIKVRLNLLTISHLFWLHSGFNSIKVRLNLYIDSIARFILVSFNSIKVRLNLGLMKSVVIVQDVSIP